ncbi:MAG: lamin tail domain-containing protein [Sphingobacteriales bacterium]|nr:lamin tail domain-containing protein [Sphingobacteriales bacterium]
MKTTLSFLLSIALLTPVCLWTQNRYAVVITEIMADPSPAVGLPANEWIELKNCSNTPVSLQNWRIADAGGQSGLFPHFILQPDSFVIVCPSSAAAAMSASGTVLAVSSFPSLDNDGELLSLKAANSMIIHAVHYASSWYRNELKKEGGWTLEMTDPRNPCSGRSNWSASIHPSGGTPGKKNSTDAPAEDATAPRLVRTYTTDSLTLVLVFDEPLDSVSGATLSHYAIDGSLSFSKAVTLPPLFSEVALTLTTPMQAGTVYHLRALNLQDCKGNSLAGEVTVKAGRPSEALPGDWIINEILFNPKPNGYDYVEFFNQGNRILDAARLFIANRNTGGVISSVKPVSAVPFYIFPGEYLVLTEEAEQLPLHYFVKNPEVVLGIPSLPSFPDEEGTVVTLNGQGAVTDEVLYKDDWHFKLIDNPEGVSLERIDPEGPSQEAGNWHSAASTAGYGTPGYKNSQYKLLDPAGARITVTPQLFSPDNDGRDDVATIQYTVTGTGYVANLTIFDAEGRPVRWLVRNGTLGLTGSWNWDGLDEKGKKLPIGPYILFTEIFNLQGKKEQLKNVIVLARKLN